MNWLDVLPHVIAKEQIAFERGARIVRARDAGAKFTEIGPRLGITAQRASQIAAKHRRRGQRPPIERYFAQPPFFLPGEVRERREFVVRDVKLPRRRLIELVREAIGAGLTVAEMAAKFGVLGVTIGRIRKTIKFLSQLELEEQWRRANCVRFTAPPPPRRYEAINAEPIEYGGVARRDGTRRTEPTQYLTAEQAAAEKAT